MVPEIYISMRPFIITINSTLKYDWSYEAFPQVLSNHINPIFQTLLTLESVRAFNNAEKMKALLEGGQLLYSKNAQSQGKGSIQIRIWILYQIKLLLKGTGNVYQYIFSLTTVYRPLKDDWGFKHFPSTNFISHQPNLLHPFNQRISSSF